MVVYNGCCTLSDTRDTFQPFTFQWGYRDIDQSNPRLGSHFKH